MRNYLIIVEGAHDIAVIERVLCINGVTEKIRKESELPEVWQRTIPVRFPFNQDRLERITPIPSFSMNAEVSVAIKNANSDSEIMETLQQLLQVMEIKDVVQINGILLVCDADDSTAEEKRRRLLSSGKKTENFALNEETMLLDVGVAGITIPVYTFIFPDNNHKGNLENLLLETAEVAYPELSVLAGEYVDKASQYQDILKKNQYAQKAKVGCIANAMKPGKANQVSIADNEWISEKTAEQCRMLSGLNEAIKNLIESAD